MHEAAARVALPGQEGGRQVATAATTALFACLIAVNVARVMRHAMWRDELQAFQLAATSNSPWELFARLKYEGHAGLWYGVLWLLTRAAADPVWMQAVHAALAIATWITVWRYAPFRRLDKILLLLSYFLFFEYFVISRSYVLAALLGCAFVAVRCRRQTLSLAPWLLLALLANVDVHATIWSLALALGFFFEERHRRDAPFFAGVAIYLACIGLAIATMIPAADFGPWGRDVRLDFARLPDALAIPLGAFVPLNLESIAGIALGQAGATLQFWNPNPISTVVRVLDVDFAHPFRMLLVFVAPVGLCALAAADWKRVAEFATAYAGFLLFAIIWNFSGLARHHGMLFLAFVAAVWLARCRRPSIGRPEWPFRLVLLISACGGVLSLASELRPFSQGRNAAQWLVEQKLAGSFLIGSRDAQVSTVAGYLGRPIYYLECECEGTFVVWNNKRQSLLSQEQFHARLLRAAQIAGGREAILIRNAPVSADQSAAIEREGQSLSLLQSFTGAVTDENYWIYRVSTRGR